MYYSWFMDTIEFFSPFVLIQLISCVLILATTIFQFDLVKYESYFLRRRKIILVSFFFKELRTRIDYNLFTLFVTSSTGTMVLFLYCYFGKLATDSMENMSDCVFELNWLRLTRNSQKYIVIMITNMQKSLYYHGFEVAILNLNTFLRVRTNISI